MKILMVASEAIPFAKTGGLADVVGSLPLALKTLGHEVAVLLPRYRSVDLKSARRVYDPLPVWLGIHRHDTSLYLAPGEIPCYLLDCPPLFDREGYYGEAGADYPDNHVRFAVLSLAALAVARRVFRPDLIHCHDWQTGLVPVYLRSIFAHDPTFLRTPTLFTIHNLGYQGLFPNLPIAAGVTEPALRILGEIGIDRSVFHPDGLEFYGKVSFIKGGLNYSDALNTVSPTYAREIQTPEQGFGLDGVLRKRAEDLSGILNGADYEQWNPETDRSIRANYSAEDLGGKRLSKQDLLAEFGLPAELIDQPLIGVVSRFTSQKGADLIARAASRLVALGLSLVALGEGEPEYERLFLEMSAAHPGRIAVRVGWSNALAHKIEAGADMFLMPSRYEPCGLNQIYSLRYGTVPVVRATGGLDDTIEEGTGFKFSEYTPEALLGALAAAVEVFEEPARWQEMMRRGMQKDFSWRVSAARYASLYQRLIARA